MDWKSLFFSAEGRIGRQEFWIGFVVLWVAGWLVNFIPVIGQVLLLVLIWCWICLYAKRLHDMGKSGWMQLIPALSIAAALVTAIVVGGVAIVTAALSGGFEDPGSMTGLFAGMSVAAAVAGVASLVCLVFLLWIGLSPSQAGENRFGAPKGQDAPAVA